MTPHMGAPVMRQCLRSSTDQAVGKYSMSSIRPVVDRLIAVMDLRTLRYGHYASEEKEEKTKLMRWKPRRMHTKLFGTRTRLPRTSIL